MVEFLANWKQWQQFPLNERKIRDILKKEQGIPGPIRLAANSDRETVRVVSGAHAGGAPGTRADPRVHVTISFRGQTYHVQLAANGGVYDVTP